MIIQYIRNTHFPFSSKEKLYLGEEISSDVFKFENINSRSVFPFSLKISSFGEQGDTVDIAL